MTVLRTQYDVLLLDLDGTLYAGAHAIPGTQAALGQGTQALYYVTNNASRSPSAVSAHLTELGFDSEDDRVVTSSQTAVRLLAERLEPGAAVLVVGTDALADEVTRVGLLPVREFADSPVAVVQGHSTETNWSILAEACLAIRGRCAVGSGKPGHNAAVGAGFGAGQRLDGGSSTRCDQAGTVGGR